MRSPEGIDESALLNQFRKNLNLNAPSFKPEFVPFSAPNVQFHLPEEAPPPRKKKNKRKRKNVPATIEEVQGDKEEEGKDAKDQANGSAPKASGDSSIDKLVWSAKTSEAESKKTVRIATEDLDGDDKKSGGQGKANSNEERKSPHARRESGEERRSAKKRPETGRVFASQTPSRSGSRKGRKQSDGDSKPKPFRVIQRGAGSASRGKRPERKDSQTSASMRTAAESRKKAWIARDADLLLPPSNDPLGSYRPPVMRRQRKNGPASETLDDADKSKRSVYTLEFVFGLK